MNLKDLTIKDVVDGVKNGNFSVGELHKEFKTAIREDDLNSYLSVFENSGNSLSNGVLHGLPIAVKDNILIKDEKTTAASKILENYTAAYNATVIEKLNKAGAWYLGKTNLDEFAMGASTENSAFGVTKNPYNPTKVAGGSSGGSAAAVASGLAVCALGSDTGGSIRQPASFCGVVGLKPTYGRVSRYGLIAMASSFDQIGPITKNVYDSALLMNVIAGHDPLDSTSLSESVPDFTVNLNEKIEGLKIAVPREFFAEGLDPKVGEVVKKAIDDLKSLGANVEEVDLPYVKYAVPTYYILVPCEVSANLARFDGIRYGLSEDKDNLLDVYKSSRARGFGDEVRRRIMIGTYALSAGYFDAYYMNAMRVRRLIKEDFDKVFEKFDVVVGPTTPTTAFEIGEKVNDPVSMYLSDIYTAPVNLVGLPAISVPCGKVDNMPVGLQIIGKMFKEETILKTAYAYEQKSK